MIRVLVVSPYPAVRAGLRALLEPGGEVEVVQAREGADPARVLQAGVDVALVDDADASPLLSSIERTAPGMGVVFLGGSVQAGAQGADGAPRGYLTRDASPEEIVSAVRSVAQGLTVIDPARLPELLQAATGPRAEPPLVPEETLTPREQEVLQLMAAGLPNKTIAVQLGISDHTAKFHVSSVLAKTGAASRTEAVTTAARRGLLLL